MVLLRLQDTLEQILQKNIKFVCNKKTLREGKLILFNIKDFYIHFMLEVEKKPFTKNYEIPIPFKLTSNKTMIFFDYSSKHISKSNAEIDQLISTISNSVDKNSQFFNDILTIEF